MIRHFTAWLFWILTGAAVVFAVRVADRFPALQCEVGRVHRSRLDPELRRRLSALPGHLFVTYWTSDRDRMPSSMRRLEREVSALLEACRRAAPDQFDYQLVDPEGDEVATKFAARRKVASFRVGRVLDDARDQRSVYSSLSLSLDGRSDVAVHSLLPENLPRLQPLLCTWLDHLHRPPRPRVGLDAPADFAGLRRALSRSAEVVELDLAGPEPLPAELDALFWMEPSVVRPERLREVEDFLSAGGSALVAGPEPYVRTEERGTGWWSAKHRPSEWSSLLAEYGLAVGDELILDARCGEEADAAGELQPMPWLVRSIAPNQDFRTLDDLSTGNLMFLAPPPLRIDGRHLHARGLAAEVVAASSDLTRLASWPARGVARDRLVSLGRAAAKQPLMVHVRSEDRWRGALLVLATSSPLGDALFDREATAHHRWLADLAEVWLRPERLSLTRTPRSEAAPLPTLSPGRRFGWRSLCIGFGPLLLFGWMLLRGLGLPRSYHQHRPRIRVVLGWTALGAIVLAFGATRSLLPAGIALTANAEAGLSAPTRRVLDIVRAASADWVLSPTATHPPALRSRLRELRRLLHRLEDAGAFALREISTEDADEETLARWEQQGVPVHTSTTREEEVSVIRRFTSALVLRHANGLDVVDLASEEALDAAEFRVVMALRAARTGARPRVAFASDSPRPAPSEAYEHYQAKGRIPPKGTDVYAEARATLREAGFDVVHVNPRDPKLPDDLDLLVWMQPRRSITPMLELAARALHDGTDLVIAAQHFTMQSHQFRGTGYELRYWPEPQTPDIDQLYFPQLGIELVREVLFDPSHHDDTLDVRVHGRRERREFDAQTSATSFHVRAVSANFAHDSLLTRNLGDQSFSSGAFLRWDEDRLRRWELRATPLLKTTERAWTYAWTAGFLDSGWLDGPLDEDGEPVDRSKDGSAERGPLTLAALFEGRFPKPTAPLELNRDDDEDAGPPLAVNPASSRPARLVLMGGSEAFQNGKLRREGLRGDQLLLNLVAGLTLPEDLAELATRRHAPQGLGWLEPSTKLKWRALVAGAPALAFALLAGVWRLLRRGRPA